MMQNAPRLLDKIVGLTSLRDVELLEFSLLKTIHGHLKPKKLSLIKLNKRDIPLMQTDFISGHCEIQNNNIQIKDGIMNAINSLNLGNSQEHTSTTDQGVITVYLLQQTSLSSSYLVMLSDNPISKLDNHLVGGFLQVHRNFCELLVESQTDELTGLANRKTFEDNISKIHELTVPDDPGFPTNQRTSEKNTYWLVMIDVDHFKRVNDNFGHLYGDEVLILIAQQLKECFRENDYIFRFGGEEFVAILRTPDKESCQAMLERLRKTIEKKVFPGVGSITISMGATQMNQDIFHITLLDYADQALYHSKNNGRNQITFFEEMVNDGQAKYSTVEAGDIDLF